MPNLAAKYRPKSFEDVTEQSLVVDMVKGMCENETLETRNFLFTGPAGCGKAIPLDQEVLSIDGYIKMRDVVPGTKLITHLGGVGDVIGIYPQGVLETYTLTFEDSSCRSYSCEVSEDHLNCIWMRNTSSLDGEDFIYLSSICTRDLIGLFYAGVPLYISNPSRYLLASCMESIGEAYDSRPSSSWRRLVSIQKSEPKECQCIYINHPDHTFITKDWIPTHNTTLCRIIANELNEGKGDPIEIDAASNSGVDSMREIISQARSYPIGSKYKIFIIDEVHALSAAAWSAALKTFEEVPAKTIFLMATTNPEKIPDTIISRVQTFQLSKISLEGIESRLKYIIDQENLEGAGITYDDDAISFIAKMANGGMRDSITLLEKAISGKQHISSESLMDSLGLPNYDDFFDLLQAYASKKNDKIAQLIDKVYNSGVNYTKWMIDFHAFIMNIVKYILLQDINKTMIPSHYESKISKYGSAHLSICLKLATKLVKLNQELKYTQYQQETTLTYLCSIK